MHFQQTVFENTEIYEQQPRLRLHHREKYLNFAKSQINSYS
jgi:hypothetical protein